MSRPKTKYLDLPKNMTARESGGRLLYYCTKGKQMHPLGDDRAIAMIRAAAIAAGPLHEDVEFADDLPMGMLVSRGMYYYINAGQRVKLGRDRLEALRQYMAIAARNPKAAYADLMTEEQIVKISQPLVRLRGVYFLVAGKTVVYVGKAIDVHRRIVQHRAAGVHFDAWSFVPCDHDLDALEAHYIRTLNPPLNSQLKRRFTNQTNELAA